LQTAFDQIATVMVLMLMAPLLPVLERWLAPTADTPSTANRRIGAGGRVFDCVRFRSMAVDAEGQAAPAAGHRCGRMVRDPGIAR
jgi:lipopolysaccharide/colanic/teichoic acid biosynthesis glycosyltransferase